MTLPDYVLKALRELRDRKTAESTLENREAVTRIFNRMYELDVEAFEADYLPILAAVWEAGYSAEGWTAPPKNPFRSPATLDPEPWVNYYDADDRSSSNDLPGSLRTFRPREGYEQDRMKYPIGQRN